MKPIKLLIKKKTRVPTKHAIVHQWRSDWKKVFIDKFDGKTAPDFEEIEK